jgi:cation:H+ antiporter
MDLFLTILYALLSIAGIILACEAFVNSIEWVGKKLNLSEGAVGSVLAAVGTALPETIIPIIAIVGAWRSGNVAGTDIGIGAIVGAPFMLATLAMFVIGAAIIVFVRQGRRTEQMTVDAGVMLRDLRFFIITYSAAILATFIPSHGVKVAGGFVLLALYGWYVWETLKHPGEVGENIAPLYFAPRREAPDMPIIVAQVVAALIGIVLGAHFFIHQVEHLADLFGLPALILSLIITPIATELPEKFNSVLWVRVKKDTLALGNVSGAMVFQSCIPPAVGLWLTPWSLDITSLFSAALAVASAGLLWLQIKRTGTLNPFILLAGGAFYLVFLIGVFGFKIGV